MEFENELDILRAMLDEANIPYKSYQVEYPPEIRAVDQDYYSGNYKYRQNQVVYGSTPEGWKIDGICQLGSYGAREGLIETYGPLGTDAEGDPLVLRAVDVFEIIKEDWESYWKEAEEVYFEYKKNKEKK